MCRITKNPKQIDDGLGSEEENMMQSTHSYGICGTSRAKHRYSNRGQEGDCGLRYNLENP